MRDRDEDLTEVTVYSNNPWLLEIKHSQFYGL